MNSKGKEPLLITDHLIITIRKLATTECDRMEKGTDGKSKGLMAARFIGSALAAVPDIP